MSNRIKLHAQAVGMRLHNARIKITANQTSVVDGSCGQKCHSGSELAEVWVWAQMLHWHRAHVPMVVQRV